jgi:uncharacterized membrane protein
LAGKPTDQEIEQVIGRMLQVGVLASAAVVAIAGVFYLARYGGTAPPYHVFHGEPYFLRSIPAILSGAMHGRRRDFILIGVLMLIATPIARVVFSAVEFARQRDYLYVAVTLIVLAVLVYSIGWSPR